MRILYIGNSRLIQEQSVIDGHDAHLLYSTKSLRAIGHEVFLDTDFYRPFFFNPFAKDTPKYYASTHFLKNSIDHLFAIIKIPFFDIPRMHRVIKNNKFNLIYERTRPFRFYSLHSGLLGEGSALYFLEVHLPVSELKDMNTNSLFYGLAEQIERRKYYSADAIFTVSATLKQFLVSEYGISENKITVLKNGVDKNIFFEDMGLRIQRRKEVGVDNETVVIGYVGAGHIQWHNLKCLCEAIRSIQNHFKFCLLCVGPTKADLLNQGIEVDSLGTVLKCVGKKTPKEINSYLNAMDICILPGTNWYCSPMKLLEYGAVGKPVIAVDMPNVREIADNENLVVFFNKNDSRDLADKIKLLCGNNELRRKIASNFRNHVLGNFSWYNNAEKIMYVFKKLSETNNHTIRN